MSSLRGFGYFMIQATIVIAACILCYGNSLYGQFVFDDRVAIVRNSDVTNKTTSFHQIFQNDFWGINILSGTSHKSYRPLTILVFNYEYNLFGGDDATKGMKLINIFLHSIISILVLCLMKLLNFNYLECEMGAVLFAVHPIHSEAVAGIVGQAELLCCLTYLTILLIFIQLKNCSNQRTIIYHNLYLIPLTVIGTLFKETGITALAACSAYDLLTINKDNDQKPYAIFQSCLISKPLILRIVLNAVATFLILYGRFWIINFESPSFKDMDNPVAAANSPFTRILSQNFLYALNGWLLLCPHWLSFDWALGSIKLIDSLLDFRVTAILLFYIGFLLLLIRGSRLIYISLALTIIPYLPASGIIRVGFVIAERTLYMPSIGFVILIVIGLKLLRKRFVKYIKVIDVCYGTVICIMIVKTIARADDWTNEERLFKSALVVVPNNAKVHYNIARLSTDRGHRDEAIQYYKQAIHLYPDYESAHMNLGNIYRDLNQLDLAEQHLKRSIEILPKFPAAWMNLGIVQTSKRNFIDAIKSFEEALSYRKRFATCHYNMGNAYIDMKQGDLAVKQWQSAIDIDPFGQIKAWANMLTYFDNIGQSERVIRLSEKAMEYTKNDSSILFIRANAFGKLNKFVEAEQIYFDVIKQRPNNALYHVNLGVLYHRWNNRHQDAIRAYQMALTIDPDLRSAKENLSKLLK